MSIPTAACRRTTSATAAAMTAAPISGSLASSRSRANNTSVTAWLRGRLPTCVVRIRSVLWCIAASMPSAVRVIRGVIARQPALQILAGAGQSIGTDFLHVWVIECELEDQPIRIRHVEGPAVPVLEDVRVGRLDASLGDPRLNSGLCLWVHFERDMMEGRRRHLRSEFVLILGIRELE